jgi:integrase
MIIAHSGWSMSQKLQLSLETGLRPVELMNLKVKDIDISQRLVYPTTAKNGASRTLKISNQLATTLQEHIIREKLNPNDKLFKGTPVRYGKEYRATRNCLARKLKDPTIQTIRLYDFRHYFATMLYHKTRDILYVKQQMGHKRIDTTLIYTQLLNLNDDEWAVKTATNIKEATELLEAGFEYIQEIDGIRLYRKRK